ncbi:MAG: hypothetical protein ACOC1P_05030 [Minisyncoccales bacterium]
MAFSGLEALTKIVNKLETEWDKQIEEQVNNGSTRISICHSESIDNAVYEELKKRYAKSGFSISRGQGERKNFYHFDIIPKNKSY